MAARSLLRMLHVDRLRQFLGVGAIGFLIEAAILTSLTELAGWSAWHARIPSFTMAVLATWLLNRQTTFKDRSTKSLPVEALMYFGTQVGGASINLLIFGVVLQVVPRAAALPVVALAAGSIGGLLFNYLVAANLVYSAERTKS